VALAQEWIAKGFDAVKFASAVADDGDVAEIKALRAALGAKPRIMCDMHWKWTALQAIKLIDALEAYDLYFAEAPCQPEDLEGLARVAAQTSVPIAAGEEWRTVYEALPRLERRSVSVIQPEMGHTGVTQFLAIGRLAVAFHARVIPHASIGVGIFQAASLHATATLPNVPYHEYQHSIFDKNLRYVTTAMRCEGGFFHLPEGPGLGVEPKPELWQFLVER
jgi:galactonate dehydratase